MDALLIMVQFAGLAWGGFLESGLLWFFEKTTSSDCPLEVVFCV
jgi:hypothetical protein